MSYARDMETLFADACNEAVQQFRREDVVYRQSVKRRAAISPAIELLAEQEGDMRLSDEMRRGIVEYISLLTGPKELEVLIACYTSGMRDCFKLMRRLDVLKK